MGQNQRSILAAISDSDHTPRDLIDRNQFDGFTAIIIGMSQVLLALTFPKGWLLPFVVVSGGFLLISIGINLLQGKEAFENRWEKASRWHGCRQSWRS
jgi:hypothetical protein